MVTKRLVMTMNITIRTTSPHMDIRGTININGIDLTLLRTLRRDHPTVTDERNHILIMATLPLPRNAQDHALGVDLDAELGAEADQGLTTVDEGPDQGRTTDDRGGRGLEAADDTAGGDIRAVVQGHR